MTHEESSKIEQLEANVLRELRKLVKHPSWCMFKGGLRRCPFCGKIHP